MDAIARDSSDCSQTDIGNLWQYFVYRWRFDIIRAITKTDKDPPSPRATFQRLCDEYDEVAARCYTSTFRGNRGRPAQAFELYYYISKCLH